MENALDFTKDDAAKDAALNQYAADYLAQEDVPMKTTTVDIQLVKADQTWKITSTTEYLDALTGGYLSAVKSLADSFGGSSFAVVFTCLARKNPMHTALCFVGAFHFRNAFKFAGTLLKKI